MTTGKPGEIKIKMSQSKCPHCGVKLGSFRYADACPHCHKELKYNTSPLLPAAKPELPKARSWLVRTLTGVLQYGGN